jgi:hypothetical protein
MTPPQAWALETFSLLLHGDSKVGKTTLAATTPLPILVLDAEGGWKFIPLRKVLWEPRQGPPPRYDGTWDVCLVSLRDWETIRLVYQWLTQGEHDFRSLVLDSITEVQRRCKANLAGTDAMQIQTWGQLLTLMDAVIRGFRDLTLDPYNPIQIAVFIAETRMVDGKWRPSMQGQIQTALPYWMDCVGYLFVDQSPDANGQATVPTRRLLISPHPMYEAGSRVSHQLGQIITEPNITSMFLQVYPQPTATQ